MGLAYHSHGTIEYFERFPEVQGGGISVKANILVTGGAGFIGSHLVHCLVRRGFAVRVLDDLSSGKVANLSTVWDQIEFFREDVRDEAAVHAAAAGMDYILHEAALVSVPESIRRPEAACDIIVRGTLNVLRAAAEIGVRRVVMAGSSAVYGDHASDSLDESQVLRPLSPYGAAKAGAEMFGRAFFNTYGLHNLTLRYFNVYGPRQDANSPYSAVIPSFIRALQGGKEPMIHGDGRQTRDFVNIEDVVEANLLAMAAPDARGDAVNIGSGRGVSLNELLNEISVATNMRFSAVYGPPRPGDIKHSRANIFMAQNLLGYNPSVTLTEGITRLVTWARQTEPGSGQSSKYGPRTITSRSLRTAGPGGG